MSAPTTSPRVDHPSWSYRPRATLVAIAAFSVTLAATVAPRLLLDGEASAPSTDPVVLGATLTAADDLALQQPTGAAGVDDQPMGVIAEDPLRETLIPNGPLSSMLFAATVGIDGEPQGSRLRSMTDLAFEAYPNDGIGSVVFDLPGGSVEIVFQAKEFDDASGFLDEELDIGGAAPEVWDGLGEGLVWDVPGMRGIVIFAYDGYMLSLWAQRSPHTDGPAPLTLHQIRLWGQAIASNLSSIPRSP
jgi:hypothetical protein